MSKMICEQCGRKAYRLAIVEDNGQRSKICESCFNIYNDDDLELPEIVILRDKQISLMGLHRDQTPRYMLNIPKDRKDDFSVNKHYDIWFKVRK